MKKYILIYWLILLNYPIDIVFAQGHNHTWLLGNYNFLQDPKGRALIDSSGISISTEFRKMSFKGTQATYSDANGNFMMSSNGIWIANANNDTMLNGAGLNPGAFASSWPYGMPMSYNNVIVPFPGDSNKYVLFHHTATFNGFYYPTNELLYSTIDMTLDNGLGGVIAKNDTAFTDTLNWGIGACRHANGRDWWLTMAKDSSNSFYKVLLTPNGITNVSTQNLNYWPLPWGNPVQLTFSRSGELFASTTYSPESSPPTDSANSCVLLIAFDRCTGVFFNLQIVSLSNDAYLWGLAFSASGKYLYACTSNYLFQINTSDFTIDTVAYYDGFISPGPNCCATTFYKLYLAADGKIYGTSGSSTRHLHVINYPDSAGVACDVQQHAIDLVDYLHLRAVPNHPNYYLGRLQGSPCDTLQWAGIEETHHDFKFRIYPNPITNNSLHIGYLLPQNKQGVFQIYDVNGKVVFKYNLPQWSNEQELTLPKLANGVYSATIISNSKRVSKIIAVMKE